MAIAFDAATTPTHAGSVTSLTFSHTTSGSNRILFVGCGLPTSDLITGVTYGGVAMTLVGKIQVASPRSRYNYLFVLVNPASGANNVVISASASVDFLGATAVSYTGAAQSGQPDASGTFTGTTVSLTTVANNCWMICVGDSNNSLTASTGATSRGTLDDSPNTIMADSNGAFTPAGSHSFSLSGSGSIGGVMASFAPFVASAVTGSLLTMGVGN